MATFATLVVRERESYLDGNQENMGFEKDCKVIEEHDADLPHDSRAYQVISEPLRRTYTLR